MSDYKSKQDGRDDAKVDLKDPAEVAYAAEQMGMSADDYKTMAKKSGASSGELSQAYIKNNSSFL